MLLCQFKFHRYDDNKYVSLEHKESWCLASTIRSYLSVSCLDQVVDQVEDSTTLL